MRLIIAANNNANTFGNSLRGYASFFVKKSIDKINVIRTLENESDNPPSWKNIAEETFPSLSEYSEKSILSAQNYPIQIPEFFNRLVLQKGFNPDNIVLDFTNGTKTWCDIVNIICTLSQIDNIYRVKIPKSYFRIPYQEVPLKEIQIIKEPIMNATSIRKYAHMTFSEFIFFSTEIADFKAWIETSSFLNVSQRAEMQIGLMKSFQFYINSDFQACIVKASIFLEEFFEAILSRIKACFRHEWQILTNRQEPHKTFGSQARTLGQICTRLGYMMSPVRNRFVNSNDYQFLRKNKDIESIFPLIPVGTICQSLTYIRNSSSHGSQHNPMLRTEVDARQFLISILYIFGKIKQCPILL